MYDKVFEAMGTATLEALAGSPFEKAYTAAAPRPQDFGKLIDRINELDRKTFTWPDETIAAIKAPALIVVGDSDIIRPEHAVALFRLLGGGVPGDMVGLRPSQLAVLPGTTHVGIIDRAEWILATLPAFLDAPLPACRPQVAR